jgi:hypothetical protein
MTNPVIPVRAIVALTARAFGADLAGVLGPRHTRDLVRPRFAACLLIDEFRPDCSRSAAGRALGGRDHSTILHALRKGRELLGTDPIFAAQVEKARQTILCWRSRDATGPFEHRPAIVVAEEAKSPPAVKSESIKIEDATRPEKCGAVRDGDVGSPQWWAENDKRFRAAVVAALRSESEAA